MTWLGGSLFVQLTGSRMLASGSDEAVVRYTEMLQWAGDRVYGVAGGLALIAGIGMVIASDAWGFGQPWVYITLGLIAVSIALGAMLASRTVAQMGPVLVEKGSASSEFRALARRLTTVGWVDCTVLTLILVMMVFKPGV